jgi:drug/metabolite transporter (DMT)-like permease
MKSWSWFLWLGLAGNVMPFLLISWATTHIASSLAGILIAAVPLLTIAVAPLIVKDEPLTWPKAAVFIIGFIGVIFMIDPSALFEIGTSNTELLAQGAILLAALGYALNGLTARRIHLEDKMIVGTGALIGASIISLPIAILSAPDDWQITSIYTAGSIIALGIFPTALAALVLYALLPRTSASFVGLSNYMVPGFAILIGVILLDEALDLYDYIGLIIVLGAVWIAGRTS